jgi:hypothetical protein
MERHDKINASVITQNQPLMIEEYYQQTQGKLHGNASGWPAGQFVGNCLLVKSIVPKSYTERRWSDWRFRNTRQ